MKRKAVRAGTPLEVLTDFELYSKLCLRIKTKAQTLVPLQFNRAQWAIEKAIREQEAATLPVRVCALKGRQLGISTYCEGRLFWKTSTHHNTSSVVVAHERDSSKTLLDMAKTMYEKLPADVRPMVVRSNKAELVFDNPDPKLRLIRPGLGSKIEIRTAGNEEAGRGSTFHHLHLSEVASWPEPAKLALSMLPSAPPTPNSSIILESTAKGGGNWWHDFYYRAKNGESDYKAIFLGWWLDPAYSLADESLKRWLPSLDEIDDEERELVQNCKLTPGQLAFRRQIISTYGEDYFHQEFPSYDEEAWLGIGTPVFDRAVLRDAYEVAMAPENRPVFSGHLMPDGELRAGPEGNFMLWEYPERGADYVIGVDAAQGAEGGSLAGVTVFKRGRAQKQVARWSGVVGPLKLVPYLEAIGWMYNEALISIEVNNVGVATQEALSHSYHRSYQHRYLDKRAARPTEKLGWYTTPFTKSLLVAHMNHVLSEKLFITFDIMLLKQLYGMAYVDDEKQIVKPEPGVGDDIFMSAAIASYTDYLDAGYIRNELSAQMGPQRYLTPEEGPDADANEEAAKLDPQWYKDVWDPFGSPYGF